jgi:hypothetical protein
MISRRRGIRAMKRGLLAVFLVVAVSSVSQAGPLGVVIEPIPNLMAGYITSSYNAATGAFSALGWALSLDSTGGGQVPMSPAPFKLVATIDNSGVATNGSLTIGNVTSPFLSGSLLPGKFAFQGGDLEFLFGTVGGSYVTSGIYTSALDRPLDVIITVGSTFLGNFTSNWSSSSNTALIREDPVGSPEPSALLVMLAGVGGLYGQFRKRKGSV